MNEHEDSGSGTTAEHVDDRISHRYDWSETDPAAALVETLSVAANSDPLTTEPLYESVDPDALNALLAPSDGSPAPDLRVSFRYDTFEVTVRTTGEVVVRPADGTSFPH